MEHGNWVPIALNDDLGSIADSGKQTREIAGGVGLGDAEGSHNYDDTSILSEQHTPN